MTYAPSLKQSGRLYYLMAAVALLLFAAFMPTAWYDSMPRTIDVRSLPFRGVDLLRLTVGIEALLLAWFALRRGGVQPIAAPDLLPESAPSADDTPDGAGTIWTLVAMTAVALALRLVAINADLWIDEIAPLIDYGPMSAAQVVGTYLRPNNH